MGALAFLGDQEIETLRLLRPGDEGNFAFPATGSDPELCLRVEELHLGYFSVNLDRWNCCIIVYQGTSEQIVSLDLSTFKCDDQEFVLAVSSGYCGLLSFLPWFIWSLCPTRLVGFCDLIISGLNQIAPHASTTSKVPHSNHEITINSVNNKLNTINDQANQCRIHTCQHTSIELLATGDSIFDASVNIGCLQIILFRKVLVSH